MILITPEKMREAERLSDERGIGYALLAANAGRALADFIAQRAGKRSAIIFLCGNGNNGCDGFEAATALAARGFCNISVALLCGKPKTEIAKAAFGRMSGVTLCENAAESVSRADIVTDCVFGTGFHGELTEAVRSVFAACHDGQLRISADIPSGADGLTGNAARGSFKADYTITFGFEKTGTRQYPALALCGKTFVADIGIPQEITASLAPLPELADDSLARFIPQRRQNSHKGDFGKLVCVCGSVAMPGAAMLSVAAALRCGAGLVSIASVSEVCRAVSLNSPEAVTFPLKAAPDGTISATELDRLLEYLKTASAVLIGCGMGASEDTRTLTRELVRTVNCPIILDADGINCIADSIDIIREARAGILLTPHPGEMARLTGKTAAEVQSDRIRCAVQFAAENGCAVLLKGAATILATPDCLRINSSGNSGMSKGGSGDVLAGAAASFIAQGVPPADAASLAAYIHGCAGDSAAQRLSMCCMLPTDIIAALPEQFLRLAGKGAIIP